MPALDFKSEFAEPVSSGQKKQTIRRKRKKPIKVGDNLYLYTGQRSANCRPLGEAVATTVLPVTIHPSGMRIGEQELQQIDLESIAVADGFESFIDMSIWFFTTYKLNCFEGDLIAWQELLPPGSLRPG